MTDAAASILDSVEQIANRSPRWALTLLALSPLPSQWLSGFSQGHFVRFDELDVANPERAREVIERHNGRVTPAVFKPTHILLAEAGHFSKILLGKTFLAPKPPKVAADQLAHVHARTVAGYILSGLSPIMCIQ